MKDALARKWISGIVVGSGFMPTTGGTMTGQLLSAVGTAGAPGIAGAGDADTGMNWPAANTLAWSTGGLECMRLNSVGLGIGTSSPGYKLDVSATGNISGQFKTSGSINALFLADAGTTPESLYIGTVGNDFRVVTGSNEIMRVTSAGKVGIGTGSPGYKLHVLGNFGIAPGVGTTVTPADNADLVIETTSNTTLTFKLKGSDGVVRTGTVALA